jgi:2-iminobutanoate/2-iminopropanoate deaminase
VGESETHKAMIEHITPKDSAPPLGPYSPAVRAGDYVFLSGQLPIDPNTQKLLAGSVAEQTRQVIENMQALLEAAGAQIQDVVKCSVYLADMSDFAEMNAVYAEFFGAAKPARSTVQAVLPLAEARLEIDCIAYLPQNR